MADDTDATGSGSKERVAFDIMVRVLVAENRGKTDPFDRSYFLKLYAECLRTVRNGTYSPLT